MLQPAVEMQKKPGKPGFFDLPLCFGRESGPIGGPGRWGGSAAPSEPLRGLRAPLHSGTRARRPSLPVPPWPRGKGYSWGRGGRRHLAAGAKGPGLPNGKPGPGAKGPRPGFSGRCAPPPPPRSAGILPTPTGQGRPMECNLNQAGSNAPAIEQVGIYDRRQGGNGDGRV